MKFGINSTETYSIIKTDFGDDSLSRDFEWFKCFKDGWQLTDDDPCSERPSISRNDDVVARICEKCETTID